MAIQVTGSTYTDPTGAVYYKYQSEQAPTGQYAEGSFLIQTKRGQVRYTQEQAQELAAKSSAKYLNIPLYEISGYESTAPAGAIVGGTLAAQASREEAYQTQQAQLRAHREGLRQGFAGTFTPYTQYVATRDIGEMVGTKQQFAQIQYLKSPTAQWASESVFAEKVAQIAPYAPSGTVFRGQIVQPLPPMPSPTMQAPSYLPQYESPFKGYKPSEVPGKYAGLATYGIFERASQISTGLQARFETAIGYSESAHPAIKFVSGFGSAFTGLPAFGGAALVGAEYYVRHPPKNALVRTLPVLAAVPGAKKTAFELIASAKTKPFETAGMFTGMAAMGRGKAFGGKGEPTLPKQLSTFEPAKGVKAIPSGRATTWNLKPTPEYIQAKFGEYNVFKGGNIEGLAKSLKTSPTAPRLPPQIRPMGVMRPVEMPKQISAATPIKGLTITEIKPSPAPKGTEVRVGQGLVQIQRQKTVTIQKPELEVIQAPKVELRSSAALKSVQIARQRARLTSLPVFQPLTKAMSMTSQRQKVSPITAFAQRTVFKTTPIMKPITSQKAIQAMKPITATAQKALVRQMPRMETRARTVPMLSTQPMLRRPTKTKLATLTGEFKFKAPSMKGFGKFGEVAKVASAKQILGSRRVRRALF